MPIFKTADSGNGQADIYFHESGAAESPVMLWGHGWGQNAGALSALTNSLERTARHIALDFPGFGQSPPPPLHWGTADYADAVADMIRKKKWGPVIWAGHSFGGRVGLQLAARHPDLVSAMILIAAAGLPRKRPLFKKLMMKTKVRAFKLARILLPSGPLKDRLASKMGSADYRNAGILRPLFVRVVNENLAEQAAMVRCPTLLIYGSLDGEAPPEIGERLHALIKNSRLSLLENHDHYSVLSTGRHQVASLIQSFLKEIQAA